ncbi:hemolysin family protein [Thermodesulfobacteriota bacterium]
MEEGLISKLLVNLSSYLQRENKEDKLNITEEEIELILDVSEKEGIIDEEESDMLHSILRFKKIIIRETMTPRTEIAALEKSSTIEDVLRIANTEKYSRIPIYEENIDNVVGILYLRDLLKYWGGKSESITIMDICRKPYFVPETKNIEELFKEFKQKKTHMAIVIDEYGGTAGIVTFEDILEEIVGDIQDEYDSDEEEIFKVSENAFVVDARIDIDEFDDYFETELPREKYETLGGFICHLTGKVPEVGESVTFENFKFEISKGSERKIDKIKVFVDKYPEAEDYKED